MAPLCTAVWLTCGAPAFSGPPGDQRPPPSTEPKESGDTLKPEEPRAGKEPSTDQASDDAAGEVLEPLGAAGPSGIHFRLEVDPSDGFLPIADRWRIGFPLFDRLNRRKPADAFTMGAVSGDYPFVKGRWFDPYNQNVLKGDYPNIRS